MGIFRKSVVNEVTGEVVDEEFRTPFLDSRGHEVLDPRPMSLPTNFNRPETLAEQVKRLVRGEMSQQAADDGFETFDEADDFEIGDENDPLERFFSTPTPYEGDFDAPTLVEAPQPVADAPKSKKATTPPAEQLDASDDASGDN